jgi:hypothetical protein
VVAILDRGGFCEGVMLDGQPFLENKEAATLAQAIVDTVREPLLVLDKDLGLVLDKDLGVLAASRSFYSTFKVVKADTIGRPLYALGDGQWDIPRLPVDAPWSAKRKTCFASSKRW